MSSSPPGPILMARAQTSALLLCLVLIGCVLTGCAGSTTAPASRPPATASQVGAPVETAPLRTTVELGRLVGRLPGKRRVAVRQQVRVVLDRWWEAAYLSGTTTRADLDHAWPGFTRGARGRARADRVLMANADLKEASVTPIMRKVRLDLLAVNKRARSVTARFDLRMRVVESAGTTSVAPPRRLQVRGRVFLTRRSGDWTVFGYDVSKGWL